MSWPRLHAAGAADFGAPWPGYIAELPMSNEPAPRLAGVVRLAPRAPFVRLARDRGALSAADVELVEEASDRVTEVAGPAEPPSRIHGDLWSGNVLWSADRVVLVDPAAHGGHRETDLAMLDAVRRAAPRPILAAYHEAAPLADGWRERVPLHQLHPLAVHVCLFGEAYRGSLLTAAGDVLAL